jgi:hypothetical protein
MQAFASYGGPELMPDGQSRKPRTRLGVSVASRLEYRRDESSKGDVFPADHGQKLLAGQDMVSMEFTYLFN